MPGAYDEKKKSEKDVRRGVPALEELKASIEEIEAQIRQNASDAGKVSGLAAAAGNDAARCGANMKEVRDIMADISAASANIFMLIQAIDDIAFHANILALNAALEASKAGRNGRGFAAVAEGVRRLASRSASAAWNAKEALNGSLADKIQAGEKAAEEMVQTLDAIVKKTEAAASLAADITNASDEQVSGIARIRKDIERIPLTAQSDPAAVEEPVPPAKEPEGQTKKPAAASKKAAAKVKEPVAGAEGPTPDAVKIATEAPISAPPPKLKIMLNDNESDKY